MKPKLLQIDDEEAICRAFSRSLHEYEVVSAYDGAQALEILKQERGFVAILCDVLMPNMNGVELYFETKKIDEALARKFIFITGSAGHGKVQRLIAEEGLMVLEKPVDMHNLKANLSVFAE